MTRNGKHSAELQTGFQVGAGDLEGLVFISGPCSALPNHCSRRRIPNGVVYRPEVEVRDGSERLYSKYNLALFEVLDKEPSGALLGVEDHDEGPAAAVLRRRRWRQSNEGSSEQRVARAAASKREAADEVEDTSDEHYRKLHRKPEYMERRIRNREIELYQYAQWQEGQRMGSERWRQLNGSHQHLAAHLQLGHVGGGSEAGGSDATGATQPQSRCASPMPLSAKPNNGSRVAADAGATKVEEADIGDGTALINETLRRLDDMQTSDTTRKRFKSGMRNELKALLDSSGYQDARARSAANNTEDNTGSGNDASRAVAKESPSPPSPQVVTSASNAVSNTSIVSADLIAASGDTIQQQQAPLSESERRVAHLGGTILEQLLIQAARLPPLADEEASDDSEESEGEASDKSSDEEDEVSEEASDEDGESQSNNGSSDSDDSQEGDADNASEAPEAEDEEDAGDSCCCPREFELPQRLFGHMTKQREQQRL
ncbi:hypothetical protein GGI03_002244 [Coemansia sp. RSA 2337]|nr:hypothetical protein LPJ71_001456 [Coemansia sp. S17]KAJ2019085.1 hypothetical protein GGI14_001844 [Coemansia sp. S680]KAJ2107162.1 hypothetical protein GGI16_001645 [Coemansia sp. S142-1]KAJ2114823.1 hypothetical protein IW146_002787 [Coemansia sp. RSA 922]KAJ2466191.1 hypothetical protein GGI03_002244 [Coemansia sp. RSA 2337]